MINYHALEGRARHAERRLKAEQAAHAETRRRLEEAERAANEMSAQADRHADEYAEMAVRLAATEGALRGLRDSITAASMHHAGVRDVLLCEDCGVARTFADANLTLAGPPVEHPAVALLRDLRELLREGQFRVEIQTADPATTYRVVNTALESPGLLRRVDTYLTGAPPPEQPVVKRPPHNPLDTELFGPEPDRG